jgi:hypothetical protein
MHLLPVKSSGCEGEHLVDGIRAEAAAVVILLYN